MTNGRSTLNSDDPLHPTTAQFRGASSEHALHVNSGGVAISLGSTPPSRLLTGSTFTSQDPLRHDDTGNTQRVQSQLLSSPERPNHGFDNDHFSRPSVYMGDRERPPLREMRPYDPERECGRAHENERTIEQDRERVRERRGSLSDHRRSFDNDRRPPPDSRRRPSFDRRPLPNDDRRLSHFDDKRLPGFVDRHALDDRLPDYERRPFPDEARTGNAPFESRPQEVLGNERRLGYDNPTKTRVPALTSVPHPHGAGVVTAPRPMDSTSDSAVAGDHQPTSGSSSVPVVVNNHAISASHFVAPLGERSTQGSSLQDRISGTYPQLGPRAELMQPGLSPTERLTTPLEQLGSTPASLLATNQPIDDSPRTHVSESSHAVDLRQGFNDGQERYSLPVADNQARPLSATYSRALSVGRDESRFQPPPPPPPLRTSSPSTFSSGQSSLTHRTRGPSRERSANFRPYFRSEFSRPPEDSRRPDTLTLQASDGVRRYDERGRWSPPPYGDRRSYREREYYDRDRPYWDSKDRARDRAPPPHTSPPNWDRARPRYPEPLHSGIGVDRRFEDRDQGNRDRWYPSSYDNSPRRQLDAFAPRARPRSPGSPSREPPAPKRVRDDTYGGGHSTTGDNYYTHSHHPPPPAVSLNKEPPPPPPPQSVPTPVRIPIPRPVSPLSQPPRYTHNPPPPLEYGGTFGGYERDGRRGPAGPGFPREGPR